MMGAWPAPAIATATAGATSTQVVASNADRAYLAVTNHHTGRAWLNIGAAAEADKGWHLDPGDTICLVPGGGGAYEWLRGAVHALSADGNNADMAVAEVTRPGVDEHPGNPGVTVFRFGVLSLIDPSGGGVPAYQVNKPTTDCDTPYDEENITDGTYPQYIDMQDYPGGCTIIADITDPGASKITLKLYLFAGAADTLDASLNWTQDTANFPNLSTAGGQPWRWYVTFPVRGLKVEVVSAGGSNDADCQIDVCRAEA